MTSKMKWLFSYVASPKEGWFVKKGPGLGILGGGPISKGTYGLKMVRCTLLRRFHQNSTKFNMS